MEKVIQVLEYLGRKLTSRKLILACAVIYGLSKGLIPIESQREVVGMAMLYLLAEFGLDMKRSY